MSGTRRGRFSCWAADLAMGARFVFTAGRAGWIRLGLSAFGIGLGVAMLLLASSIPHLLEAQQTRQAAQTLQDAPDISAGDDTAQVSFESTDFRDSHISGMLVKADGDSPPVPPGIDEFPAPDKMYVSPALAKILESSDADLLKPRFGQGDFEVVDTIDDDGLVNPHQLYFYMGTSGFPDGEADQRIDSFGAEATKQGEPPAILVLLIVVAIVVLLLPVMMFLAVAVRHGGEQRERRLAALRLVGADRAMIGRVCGGESLVSALCGLVLGSVFLFAGRNLGAYVPIDHLSFFASDMTPDPIMAGGVLLAVPVLSVLVSVSAMRRVIVEPLGVVRHAAITKRRLWWRLLLPALGLVLLYPSLSQGFTDSGDNSAIVACGILSLLLGVGTLLPWIVDFVVMRMRGGGVAWQLATRRLQMSGGSLGRVVNGIAVAVAGAIALQMIFIAASQDAVSSTSVGKGAPNTMATVGDGFSDLDETVSELKGIDGVEVRGQMLELFMMSPSQQQDVASVLIADCDVLRQVAHISGCADGDVFTAPHNGRTPEPGTTLTVARADTAEKTASWKMPGPREKAGEGKWGDVGLAHSVLATPQAMDPQLLAKSSGRIAMDIDSRKPNAVEHVRNQVEPAASDAQVTPVSSVQSDDRYESVRNGILAGVAAVLTLIGLSLLISMLEQLQERRRLLSVLRAFGSRRRDLALSVCWQAAVPITLGVLFATGAGIGLGAILTRMVGTPVAIDWLGVAQICGIAAGAVMFITVLSMPLLWRLMRSDGLRTE